MAKKTFRFNLLRKKSKGPPGGIEVKTAIASNNFDTTNSSTANGSKDKNSINGNTAAPIIVAEDEVSAMTPATGMPPDSPDRLRNLPSLLRPISQTTISDKMIDDKEEEDKDHAEAFDVDFPDEDELSAMTPVSPDRWEEGGGSKKRTVKKYQLRWKGVSPRNILLGGDNDDACSPGVTVYEDDEASSSGWEHRQQFQQQNHEQKATPPATISKPTNILLQSPLSSSSSTSSSSSWLTRTKYFQKAIDSSFEMIDVDKSGDVTLEELYAGLLLIHLNMAVYVGPPACRPASKAYVTEIFHLLDSDNSGTLTKDEYAVVVKILYSQVFTRIVMQWSLTLMIVPIITQYILKSITLLYFSSSLLWKDRSEYLDPLQHHFRQVCSLLASFTLVERVVESLYSIGQMIPSGIWKTLPFTILTLGQTSILLPWVLHHVENVFRRAAQSNAAQKIDGIQGGKKC